MHLVMIMMMIIMMPLMMMKAMAADETSGGYQAGEMTITATVHVEFALLP